MYEKEEQMLRDHAEHTGNKADLITDEMLDAAISGGIARGKRRKRGRRRNRTLAAVAGALTTAALLWLALGGQMNRPEIVTAGPYPQLQGFEFGPNVTLNTANKHGFIQPVGKSAAAGDYTVTVEGVLTGSQQLYVFYSVENRSDREIVVQEGEMREASTGKPMEGGGRAGSANPLAKGKHQNLLTAWYPEGEIPGELSMDFNIYGNADNQGPGREAKPTETVTIDFRLDLGTSRQYVERVPLQETIEVEGQKMTLAEAVFSPAGVVVKGVMDDKNSYKVEGVYRPYLVSVKDGIPVKLINSMSWLPGESGEFTYFFESNHLDQPDSIMLKGSGLNAVDPELLKVVVDIEKGVVLRSPADEVEFESYEKEKAVHILKLKHKQKKPGLQSHVLSFESGFQDGKGETHREQDHGSLTKAESRTENGVHTSINYLYLKPGDYPQPLTFTLSSYPGLLEKDIAIPLK